MIIFKFVVLLESILIQEGISVIKPYGCTVNVVDTIIETLLVDDCVL